VPPEDVVNVLSQMIEAAAAGGLILDLQVIRPDPVVELDRESIAVIDGTELFAWADAATAAIDARIATGDLAEEAVDDHDVCTHYSTGDELVDDFTGRQRVLESDAPRLRAIDRPLLVRERSRLRRLRVRRDRSPTLVRT
jgi:hypothetical protein